LLFFYLLYLAYLLYLQFLTKQLLHVRIRGMKDMNYIGTPNCGRANPQKITVQDVCPNTAVVSIRAIRVSQLHSNCIQGSSQLHIRSTENTPELAKVRQNGPK